MQSDLKTGLKTIKFKMLYLYLYNYFNFEFIFQIPVIKLNVQNLIECNVLSCKNFILCRKKNPRKNLLNTFIRIFC